MKDQEGNIPYCQTSKGDTLINSSFLDELNIDDAKKLIIKKLMENKYYKEHYHLYGYEAENFHDMIKLIMCKIAFAASEVETDKKGKLQKGGGMGAIIKTFLIKYKKHLQQEVFSILCY